VPVAAKDWLFTVTMISERTELHGWKDSWSTKKGYVFVIVDYLRRNLSKRGNTLVQRGGSFSPV